MWIPCSSIYYVRGLNSRQSHDNFVMAECNTMIAFGSSLHE